MDRRLFMAGTLALGASCAFGSVAGRARRLDVRLALKLGMIAGGETLAEKFAIARAAGFAGVELDSPSGLDAAKVAEAKAATGMIVPGVVNSAHWSKPLNHGDAAVRDEGIAALERAIRDAHAWCDRPGGRRPTVLLVPAVVRADMPYAEAYEASMVGIGRVLPLARELDVCIAIENVWNDFLLSPLEAARYVDELNSVAGSNVVGWYLDIGNLWRYGWPSHWVEVLGERIVRLDIKGYSRAKADAQGRWAGFGVEIGDGDLDWPLVRSALDRIGYSGWATAEVGGGDAARLRDIRDRMARVLGVGDAADSE